MYKNTLKKSYPQKLCTMWITLSTGGGQLFQERKRQGRKERERRAEKNERKGKVNCLKMRGEYGIIGYDETMGEGGFACPYLGLRDRRRLCPFFERFKSRRRGKGKRREIS